MLTGADVCPAKPCSLREIHINGDISFAVQQYLHVLRDVDFLKNRRGYEMISELARYWESRVEFNNTSGYYDITGINRNEILQLGLLSLNETHC